VAGYTTTRSGRRLAYALIVNDVGAIEDVESVVAGVFEDDAEIANESTRRRDDPRARRAPSAAPTSLVLSPTLLGASAASLASPADASAQSAARKDVVAVPRARKGRADNTVTVRVAADERARPRLNGVDVSEDFGPT
jgi:hypothetical protein